MTPDEIKRKIDDLQKRTDAVAKKKAQFSGQLQAKKEELAALIKEVKAAGYDPKTLVGDRDRAKAELEQMLGDYESELTKTEAAFTAFEKK